MEPGFSCIAGGANPVDRLAARVGLLDHRLAGMAAAQPGDAARQQVGVRPIGNVDIEQKRLGRQPLRQHLLHHGAYHPTGGVQIGPALAHLRKGDRRNAEQVTLHRRRHGARVQRVVTHVGALVDAREHQVGPVAQQAGQGHVHAVGRRAVDETHTGLGGPGGEHLQRPVQRERVGGATGILLGRDDLDLAQALHRRHQSGEPGGEVPVVVGNEYAHRSEIVGTSGRLPRRAVPAPTTAAHPDRRPA